MRGSSVFLKERSLQVDNYSPVILYRRIHGTMHGGIPEIMEILTLRQIRILNSFILVAKFSHNGKLSIHRTFEKRKLVFHVQITVGNS